MENTSELLMNLQEKSRLEKIANQLKTLVKAKLIEQKEFSSIENYTKVDGIAFIYGYDYYFYKHNEKEQYAFINYSSTSNNSNLYIYKMDFSDEDVIDGIIKELERTSNTKSSSIVTGLNIVGWLLLILGFLFGLFGMTQEGMLGLSIILGSIATALLFFALARIIVHLYNIEHVLRNKD